MSALRVNGWVALGVSLAFHAALGAALALFPGGPPSPDADGLGPPTVELVFEELDDGGHLFLVPRGESTAQSKPAGASADLPREVGVTHGSEDIIPAPRAEVAPPGDFGQAGSVGEIQGAGPAGAGGHAGSAGTGQAGGLFPSAGQARRVVYVIDRSSSMGLDGLLAAAVRELRASLERLPDTVQFQVIVYHDRADPLLAGGLLPARAENVARAAAALDAVRAEGQTDHREALLAALALSPEVIYLLTDADDLRDEDRVAITRLNRGRAVIHTIELNTANRDRTDMPLQALARQNRGRYLAVSLGSPR